VENIAEDADDDFFSCVSCPT